MVYQCKVKKYNPKKRWLYALNNLNVPIMN